MVYRYAPDGYPIGYEHYLMRPLTNGWIVPNGSSPTWGFVPIPVEQLRDGMCLKLGEGR